MMLKDVSPEVLWFAGRMQEKLNANSHKCGWKNEGLQYLSMRLTQERKELTEAFKSGDKERVIKECADLANFAMMIADNFNNELY
jgi:NTP pyrophosphatase (non-canonical NTP hydrolase)